MAIFPLGEEGKRDMSQKALCPGQMAIKDSDPRHGFVSFPSADICVTSAQVSCAQQPCIAGVRWAWRELWKECSLGPTSSPPNTMVVTATQTAKVPVPEFQVTSKETLAQSRKQLTEARRAEVRRGACLMEETMGDNLPVFKNKNPERKSHFEGVKRD